MVLQVALEANKLISMMKAKKKRKKTMMITMRPTTLTTLMITNKVERKRNKWIQVIITLPQSRNKEINKGMNTLDIYRKRRKRMRAILIERKKPIDYFFISH